MHFDMSLSKWSEIEIEIPTMKDFSTTLQSLKYELRAITLAH